MQRLIHKQPSTSSPSEERYHLQKVYTHVYVIPNRVASGGDSSEGVTSDGANPENVRVEKPLYTDNKELRQLQELLKQRDDEISNS